MTPAIVAADLDRSLAEHGADVTVVRPGTPPVTVPCRARVVGLNAQQLRPASSSGQGTFRAIMSPTALKAAGFPFPIRTTDKITWSGQQRTITYAWPWPDWANAARIEVDFQG